MRRYDIDPKGNLVDIDDYKQEDLVAFGTKALEWAIDYAVAHYGDFRFSNQHDAKHRYRLDMQAYLDENCPPELPYNVASNALGLCVLKACMFLHNDDYDMNQCHEYPDGHPRFTQLEQLDSIHWLVVAASHFLTRRPAIQKYLDYYNTINRNLHAIDPTYYALPITIEDIVVKDGNGLS